jgi:hypothetical protein
MTLLIGLVVLDAFENGVPILGLVIRRLARGLGGISPGGIVAALRPREGI